MAIIHQSVLLNEILEFFSTVASPSAVYLDATMGSAGHTTAILEAFPEVCVVANDQDESAHKRSSARLEPYLQRVQTTFGNFSSLSERLPKLSAPWVPDRFEGILMDLGISSEQLAEPGRGFSFSKEEPLDMRMDMTATLNAREVLNTYSPRELKRVFARGGLGPERAPLVNQIIRQRPIETTTELARICEKTCRKRQPAALPFQAIRIEVNKEFEVLESFLEQAPSLLKPASRLAVISFHSLEDKIVAKTMRAWSRAQESEHRLPESSSSRLGRLLTPKAITPTEAEIKNNPRARSARLRVFEMENA